MIRRRTAHHQVPGRIEVLGKHTDYAGGRSLLCAVGRGFRFSSAARDDGIVRVEAAVGGSVVHLDPERAPRRPAPSWRRYPEVVLRRVRADFGVEVQGCDIVFSSDLPSAAGLSSSSALVVGVFLALDRWSGLVDSPRGRRGIATPEGLADYLAAVEAGRPFPGLAGAQQSEGPAPAGSDVHERGVGTRGGSEDHTAMLCAVPDSLVRYAFRPARREGAVPLPEGLVFAVASSGVRAPKAGRARDRYNRLSDLAGEIAELWRKDTGGTATDLAEIAREVGAHETAGEGDLVAGILKRSGVDRAPALLQRWRHFVSESEELVPAAFAALRSGDLAAFGTLADRSQALAERLLGNQVPETVMLARTAREEGVVAASAFGAGFGGSVWALVDEADADDFLARWRRRYHASFPARAGDSAFFLTNPADPACPLPERLAGR